LPEKKIPDCAGFLFGFKAQQQAHSELCNCWGNAEAEQKDQQDGIFFDRNRLNSLRRRPKHPSQCLAEGRWRKPRGVNHAFDANEINAAFKPRNGS